MTKTVQRKNYRIDIRKLNRARKVLGIDTILNLAREISFLMATNVANRLMEAFSDGGYDAVYLAYNEFKSAIAQEIRIEKLLPVDISKASLSADSKVAFSRDLMISSMAWRLSSSFLSFGRTLPD